MNNTKIYNYKKPEPSDKVKIDDLNDNVDKIEANIAELSNKINDKSPVKSPTFLGEPKAPNPNNERHERIATTGYVTDALEVEVL